MNGKLKFGILALAAVIAVVAIGASSAAADPADTNNPPTTDWVFDSGSTTTLLGKTWTVQYNMTVMNGSKLIIDRCTFTMNGTDPSRPIWIFGDTNSTIEIKNSDLDSPEGSSRYYIEAFDNITLSGCTFLGIGENMLGDAGISVYGNKDITAKLEFVTVNNTRGSDAIYIENSQVDMDHVIVNNTEGGYSIFVHGDATEPDETYDVKMWDCEVYNAAQGPEVYGTNHYGIFDMDIYSVIVQNVSSDGFIIYQGDDSSDDGNGTVQAVFNELHINDTGRFGLFLSQGHQESGTSNLSNVYNITLTNTTIHNTTWAGIYIQLYQTVVEFYLTADNLDLRDIALEGSTRMSGIFYWFYYSTGSGEVELSNTKFTRCNPAGLEIWDFGSATFHLDHVEFAECTQYGIYDWNDYWNADQSSVTIENSTFHDIDGYGINCEFDSIDSGSPIMVKGCGFWNLTDSAMRYDSDWDSSNIGFNVSDSYVHDVGGHAIEITAGEYTSGTIPCHVIDTVIDNTKGIKVTVSEDKYQTGYTIDVRIVNSTINDTKGTALLVTGGSYYSTNNLNLLMLNSTIHTGMRDGVYLSVEMPYKYYNQKWNSDIRFINSTIEDLGGVALGATSPAEASGARFIYMNNTTIYNCQRGIFSLAFPVSVYHSKIQGCVKEDVLALVSKVELWYVEVDEIIERKYRAADGGEIVFYFDLDIYVKWETGAAAIGANVYIYDNKNNLILVETVLDPTGHIPTKTMNPYFVRETGLFGNTPYIINVTFLQVGRTIGVKLDRNKVVEIILEDHFEPEVFILYPKQGHIQQSTTLQVRGSAWDSESGIKTVQVSLDGVDWYNTTGTLRWNYTFEVNDTLIGRYSGQFLLRAKAVDNALNERTAFILVRIDPTPPELNVDFPYDGYVTNNPELWVRGVTEVGSRVEINSVPVPVTVSMFTHKVDLIEGPNTISVISIDPLGNIQIKRMEVTLDTQPPYIILLHPEEDMAMTNEDTITIEATVEDDLDITINGYHVPYDSDWYPMGAGRLTYPVELEHGENVVVIQARDEADNLVIMDFTVVYDTTPPWIQVISPKDGDILPKPEVTVIGTIDTAASLRIQGESVTVRNGFFEIVILAFEGENTLEFAAEDVAGNVYEEDLTFHVDTQDPYLEITEPEQEGVLPVITNDPEFSLEGTTALKDEYDQMHVTGRHIKVHGVYDEEAGRTVTVELTTEENGTFALPVMLLEGSNEFVIVAEDDVGNSATQTVTVRLDTVAPTLVMYIDPAFKTEELELVSNALTVNITGYTDPGSYLTINDIPLPVSEEGEFSTSYDLSPTETELVLRSTDLAENERTVSQTITYQPITTDKEEGLDWGLILLIIAIILLLVVIIATVFYVRGRREDMLEMEAAEATPLAPVDETVVEEPDTLPGPEEIDLEEEGIDLEDEEEEDVEPTDEPAPTTAPARPRPKSPQARRAAAPRPVPSGERPEVEEKDLSEKDAEADIGADETDQEGI